MLEPRQLLLVVGWVQKPCSLPQSIDAIGQLSCNPSIGGIGKGHLVKEIDALGGAMGVAADQSGIHFKTLNSSKGPAVRATRAQIDRERYRKRIQAILSKEPNITVMQQQVKDLWIEQDNLLGVITQLDVKNTLKSGDPYSWNVFKWANSCWSI